MNPSPTPAQAPGRAATDRERPVLEALYACTRPDEFYSGFNNLVHVTGLPRSEVRLRCRSLARKGLARFARGLTTDDGMMAGAGYAITALGCAALATAALSTSAIPDNSGDHDV